MNTIQDLIKKYEGKIDFFIGAEDINTFSIVEVSKCFIADLRSLEDIQQPISDEDESEDVVF